MELQARGREGGKIIGIEEPLPRRVRYTRRSVAGQAMHGASTEGGNQGSHDARVVELRDERDTDTW